MLIIPNILIDIFGLSSVGTYSQVRDTNNGGEVHHMPANSINGLPYGKDPSIWMEKEDYYPTASHGRQGKAGDAFRKLQAQYIAQNRFDKAMEMDIKDIKSKFGTKYDRGMIEAVETAKENN